MTTLGISRTPSRERIRDADPALTQATDLASLFAALHAATKAALDAESMFLGLYNEASHTIDVVRQGEFGTEFSGGTFPLGDGVTSEAIRTGQSRLIRHWSEEGPPVHLQFLTTTPGLPESAITVPLLYGDRVLGVLAAHKYEPDAFDQADLQVLEAIAAQTSVALVGIRESELRSARLHERVSQLESVLGSMADAVLLLDAEGSLVSLNRAARELLCGDNSSIVLGQPLEQQVWGLWPLGTRELTEALRPLLTTVQQGETPPEAEMQLEQHGRRRFLSFNATPLFDVTGHVIGSVLVVRDVTARRQMDELKDEMLSVASHDLKTPVTVIRSDAQLMRREIARKTTSLEEVDDGLRTIVRQTDRLSKLLSLLLDVSRIDAGRFEIAPSQVDLGRLASTTLAEVQATTDEHLLELHVSGQPTGYWDERRLQQVLLNLLTNAIKYSPKNTPIAVDIRAERKSVTVSVIDRGIGLAPDESVHVFERFFRARSTRRLEGSGLGLYICQSIVAAHGGRIWVESAGSGKGSVFRFTLPRSNTHHRATANPREYSPVAPTLTAR
ncbi:MAG: GAF domain-containing protein [Chloroflexi bacterium]|nr:GAF domain-containing protein [Chloroflexota bacterium]